jgi:hypothetical protein
MALTERGTELLIPIIGDRMKFIEAKESFPKDMSNNVVINVEENVEDDPQDGVDMGEGTSVNTEPVAAQNKGDDLNTSARFVKIASVKLI